MGCFKLSYYEHNQGLKQTRVLSLPCLERTGSPVKNRVSSYSYAYNGMETDPEIKGDGNSYTTEFRQYDPRVGRWMSLDPLMMQFPWMSPYVGFDNNPVYYVDPYGLEGETKDGKCGAPPCSGSGDSGKGEARAARINSESNPIQLSEVKISAGLTNEQLETIKKRNEKGKFGYKLNSTYRVEEGKIVECGIMYSDAISGRVIELLLEQGLKNQLAIMKEDADWRLQKYNAQKRNDELRMTVNEYNLSHNIFGIGVLLSPGPAVYEAYQEAEKENYLTAAGILLFEFAPGNTEDIIKSSRRIVKGKALAGQHALRKKVQTLAKSKYYNGIKETQQNAESIIRSVMDHPNRIMGKPIRLGGTGGGSKEVIPFFNPVTGQGVGINVKTGEFETFLNMD